VKRESIQRRRQWLRLAAGLVILGVRALARAQSSGRVRKVGILSQGKRVDMVCGSNNQGMVAGCFADELPAVSPYRPFAEAGGLMSLGPDLPVFRRGLASYVDRILHGARPATLAIEQPNVFALVLNAKAATALGLTLPPPLLLRANEVLR
jgi:hypothetical protein